MKQLQRTGCVLLILILLVGMLPPVNAASGTGYTVKMPGDLTGTIGETVQLPITIGNKDGKTGYHAFDLSFTYDPAALELVYTRLPGVTVAASSGKVHVLGYGGPRNAGSVPVTLEFKVLKSNAEVRLTSACVDHAHNAVIRNASPATLLDDRTAITAAGYSVTLPTGFTGAAVAVPDMPYTFAEPKDGYDYTVKATVNGIAVKVINNGDGTYTIPAENVTGSIVVTATRKGTSFHVTLGTDMTGKPTAQYGTNYTATLHRDSACSYSVTVTIGGKKYTGYSVSGNTYTIPGGDITGDIVFTVKKVKLDQPPVQPPADPPANPPADPPGNQPTQPSGSGKTYPVTITGSGAGAGDDNSPFVVHGSAYTLTLEEEKGYAYRVYYKTGSGEILAVSPDANGKYVIKNVTGPLEIIIERSLDIELSIHEYVNLDEKTVFLVLIPTEPDSGRAFAYHGSPMVYSEAYDAWAWLTIEKAAFDLETAKENITIMQGSPQRLKQPDHDVDALGTVDLKDAQLACEIYNAKYEAFEQIGMINFLNADVNMDKVINVMDAAGIAANIK